MAGGARDVVKGESHNFVFAESRDTSLEESAERGRRVYAWTLATVGCERRGEAGALEVESE